MANSKKSFMRWFLWIIIPLCLGVAISLTIPQPVIGTIYLDDAIYRQSAQDLITQIIYAREDPKIKAVVLVMNSPGGTVSDTESVYLELLKLREKKPVVTVVEGMAASGGYYLAAGSDYIFSKSSSSVGNIGVVGYLPSSPEIVEEIYSTGPYKLWGSSRDRYIREIDMLKNGFLEVVLHGRKDRLNLDTEEILSGVIWTGAEAMQLGLVDELGGQSQAYQKAAGWAKISHYRVENLRKLSGLPDLNISPFFIQTDAGIITPYPRESGIYYLYIPSYEGLP